MKSIDSFISNDDACSGMQNWHDHVQFINVPSGLTRLTRLTSRLRDSEVLSLKFCSINMQSTRTHSGFGALPYHI